MRNKYNHFPNAKRLFYRALHIVVICILMYVGAMPLSAQVYSTAQRYTPYDSHTNAAYGASYNSNGYAEQPAYNPYQSTVYQPFASSPSMISGRRNTGDQPPQTGGGNPTNPDLNDNDPGGGELPDGWETPSDPGHQSNQSPVGEAWILLLFAAAAAWVVFRRQQREKKHIAIYSENQQQAETSNMKQHIRKSLFISIILLAGVSNAWAVDWHLQNNASKIYFSDLTTNWVPTYANSHHIIFLMGRDNNYGNQGAGSQAYDMKYLQNTRLWYYNVPKWGDGDNGRYQYIAFRYATSAWTTWEGNTVTHRATWENSKYTMTRNDNISGKTLFYDPESSATNTNTIVTGYLPKYTATADIKISEDGGNTYAVTHDITLGTLTLTGTYMNGDAATGQSTETTNGTNDYKYENIPVTGEFTLTNTSVTNAAYEFVGFGTGDKPTINSNSHTWNVTANTTYYAFYKHKQYTINYGVFQSIGGSIKLNSGNSIKNSNSSNINHGSKVTFTATPSEGYTIEGWYSNAECTTSLNNGTKNTYTINSLTAGTNIYVKFKEKEFNVAVVSNNSNFGTTSPNSVVVSISRAANITAEAKADYKFDSWKVTSGNITINNPNSASTTITATSEGTVTANFSEKTYPISIKANNANFGTVNISSTNIGKFTSSANITATANDGYEFVNWTATDGITINNPNNATTTIKATKAGTLTANFQALPGKNVYLQPVDYWLNDNARFAVYAWNGSSDEWIEMEDVGCNREYFSAEIPAQFKSFKFVRINPAATELSFANDVAWNQTPDLSIPTDGKNLLIYPRIYLKPNSNWKKDNARFAARFYQSSGGNEEWVDMTDADGDGYYSCKTPEGYDKVIFCRMNPATTENNWDNRWNQTGDLSIPKAHIGSANCFTLNDGSWDSGTWTTLETTYSAPKYSVTLNATNNGTTTATYNSTTKTSKNKGTATLTNIPLNQNVTFTFEPAEGYQFANAKITIGNQELEVYTSTFTYPICGPATVSAHFVATETRKIYLRPNDDWMKDSPVFATYAFKEGSDVHQWYIMNTEDTDYTGAYSCDISTTYDHVHFVRINPKGSNPHNQGINWANAWNQTIALEIVNDIYNTQNKKRFEIIAKNTDSNKGDLNHYDGAWEENTPIWGITSDFDNWHAEDAVFMGYPGKLNILLSAASHEFKLYNFRHGHYYGNTGKYTRSNNGEWWTMDNKVNNNCTVTADVDNEAYLFQLQLITETGTYKKQISITYPDYSAGAYRLAYRDNTPNSFHPAHLIRCNTQKDLQLDTISFFVRHDKEPEILLQQCSSADVYTDNPVWTTLAIYPATSSFPSGDHPNNAMLPGKRASDATIHIGEGCGVTSTAVYNFILQQTNTGEHSAELDTRATHLYEGNYYIRTDYAEGGWTNYLEPANLMTYSSYADHYEPFSYYFCKWVNPKNKNEAKANITYTIANPYSRCISDTLIGDAIIAKNGVTEGYLPDSANVRFTWDHETNALARAYIAGSGHKKDRFLVLEGNESLLDINGKRFTGNTAEGQDRYNLTDDEVVFDDMGNWIYQMDVKANKDTKIDLTAKYNNLVQYFKGGSKDEDEILLIVTTNDNEKYYKIRIIYDFKTNHLISAWLPEDETITTDEQLGADMMIIRHNQEKAEQLNFNPLSSSLTKVGTAYAVMTFDKYFLNNKDKTGNELAEKKSENERKFYWISFPFDVKLSEVFGFGEYGDQWIMEYYDGEARAKEGYWAETETFWKYITNKNYVLKAGQGYVLCLNLNKMGFTSTVFAHTTEVSLYFPSTGPLNTITGELPNAVTVPAHECTIERDNRNIYDSNWNLIGVPGFADIEEVTIGGSSHTEFNDDIHADCVSFYYKYLPATNKYDATNNEENFQTMYAYMVQFAGTINWRAKTMPAQLAARRTGSMPSQHDLRLEIAQGEQTDQTFVQLKEADATAEFDMNIDMTKIFNSGMNIYTLTGSNAIQVAGNALPMEKATVPVGVRVDAAGEYTFRMPDGTDGIAVTLVDNATGTHTNMLMSEYTVTLDAGTIENRFYLVVDPDRTATSVENVGEEAKGDKAKDVEKFLIDGKLFIRTADGIFDAKGQRL